MKEAPAYSKGTGAPWKDVDPGDTPHRGPDAAGGSIARDGSLRRGSAVYCNGGFLFPETG